MEWKLSEKAEETKRLIENGEELDESPFGGSDGLWYDITDGGYCNPDEILTDAEQLKKVKDAVEILRDFENNVYDKIVPEF